MRTPMRRARSARKAFTITELMIAMAVTLLMMGALAQAFKLVGESMRTSRSDMQLSGKLRGIAFRLRDDLGRVTAPLTPPLSPETSEGYFLYYEGPHTDATSILFGQAYLSAEEMTEVDFGAGEYHPHAKYGDFDDYVAFTAEAPDGAWFTGKVPQGIIDFHRARNSGWSMPSGYDPNAPVTIRSKYAEIILWASPQWQVDGNGAIVYANGVPQFRDDDGNGLPDQILLHRRVLLIRPDLNVDPVTGAADDLYGDGTPYLPWLENNNGSPRTRSYEASSWTQNQTGNQPNWLVGMAALHQQMDLSIGRLTHPVTGFPQQRVLANSMASLTRPENRFAHVRVPAGVLQGNVTASPEYSSMPLLALCGPPPLLASASTTPVPDALTGFLRPEFQLTGARGGEDVVAVNVLGFDARGYDPEAPSLLTVGPDGAPGTAGLDDDGNGTDDDASELGAAGSDDQLVTPTDVGFFAAMRSGGSAATQGNFVDLDYPALPGGPLLGFGARTADPPLGGAVPASARNWVETSLSGRYSNGNVTANVLGSGRVLTAPDGIGFLLQPTYDTWSTHYESDGFYQGTAPDVTGIVWGHNDTNGTSRLDVLGIDLGANNLDEPGSEPGVDDATERETRPPYAAPLRGLQILIRIEEPGARQIRQMTISQHFEQ